MDWDCATTQIITSWDYQKIFLWQEVYSDAAMSILLSCGNMQI